MQQEFIKELQKSKMQQEFIKEVKSFCHKQIPKLNDEIKLAVAKKQKFETSLSTFDNESILTIVTSQLCLFPKELINIIMNFIRPIPQNVIAEFIKNCEFFIEAKVTVVYNSGIYDIHAHSPYIFEGGVPVFQVDLKMNEKGDIINICRSEWLKKCDHSLRKIQYVFLFTLIETGFIQNVFK